MAALATIEQVFWNPLVSKSEIIYHSQQSSEVSNQVLSLTEAIDETVKKKLGRVNPLTISHQEAARIAKEIKDQPQWQNDFQELLKILAPQVNQDAVIDAISRPWWNKKGLFRASPDQTDIYDASKPSLELNVVTSHTYITQLMYLPNMELPKLDSASVNSVLLTKDGWLILGLRGGQSYSDTYMVIPAGSLETHTGKNPLFETLNDEYYDETGAKLNQEDKVELIGRIYDHTLGHKSEYVFRTQVDKDFSEVVQHWNKAIDQKEHKALEAFRNDPEFMLKQIRENGFKPEYRNPKTPVLTLKENIGTILPPAAGSILTHFTQQEGREWLIEASKQLNQKYL
jgi:hypothetical protein